MNIEQIGLVVVFVVLVGTLGSVFLLRSMIDIMWETYGRIHGNLQSLRHRVGDLEYKYRTKVTTTATVNPRKPKTFKVKPKGRTPKLYAFEGATFTMKEWASMVGLSEKTLYKRVGDGKSLLTPEEFARISKGVQ